MASEPWSSCPLGDLFVEVRDRVSPADVDGLPYVGLEHIRPGSSRIDEFGGAGEVSSLKTRFAPGDSLFGRLRPYLRKVAYADLAGICSTEITVLRAVEGVDPLYLYYRLAAPDVAAYAVSRSTGSRMPRIDTSRLSEFPIELPSLALQGRIADLLGEVDRVGESAGLQLSRLRRARAAALAELLASPAEDWRSCAIGDVADFAGGVAFPRHEQGQPSGEYPLYKVSDMNAPGNETVLDEAANWIDADRRERLGARIWPAGTVVFPKVGAALKTEKRRLLARPAAFDNNVMGLVPRSEAVLPRFLLALMERVRLSDLAQEGAMPSVNQRVIGRIPLHLPPLERQGQMLELLDSFDLCIQRCRATRGATATMRDALLAAVVSGRFEIPDSYDRFLAGAGGA